MRTTVDIPDPVYRQLKVQAATEGTTIKELILESLALRIRLSGSVETVEQRPPFPVVRSKNPGSLQLGDEGVYEYIPFP